VASILTAVRDLERARQIAFVLARHGFGEVVSRIGLGSSSLVPAARESTETNRLSSAQRLRLVLEELGPSFVKLGQIASTRPDLIPPDVVAELKKLQDSVPPFPSADARAQIEEQLGTPLGEIFADFCETPVASASIAQVHRARLRTPDGDRDVVIKVQRPNIRNTIERDVDLLYWFAHTLERAMPESRTYAPVDVVAEFDRAMTAELDFVQEADNAETFAKNFEGSPVIRFPTVYRQASGKRVLTLEFLDGKKLERALADGASGKTIANNAVEVIIKMVFEDGFFHADPHPGNLLILGPADAPVIGMFDLGLVGRLSPFVRDKAIDMMIAAARDDMDALADAVYALGKPTRKVDRAMFRADVARIARQYLKASLQDIDVSSLVQDIIRTAQTHGIDIPADFLMVGKAVMTVEGIGRQLDPGLNVFEAARPHFVRLLARRYSPDKLGNELLKAFMRVSGVAGNMPEQVGEILEDIRKGHLELRAADPALPASADRLGRRLFAGATAGSLAIAGAMLLATGRHEWMGHVLLASGGATALAHVLRDWWRSWQNKEP
jgi:ubiquinone biosynthesis protein